ncbi:MAG: helix-turn-helix domain-containing protein [Parvularculaceae bacterium]
MGFDRSRFRVLFLAINRDPQCDIAWILAHEDVILELLPIPKSGGAILSFEGPYSAGEYFIRQWNKAETVSQIRVIGVRTIAGSACAIAHFGAKSARSPERLSVLEFGSLLRLLRTHLALTQTEMADFLHMSQPVYSRVEAGRRPLSMTALQRIAEFLEVSVEELVFAFFLLDDNLKEIERRAGDPVNKLLLAMARKYRDRLPTRFKDAAALGLLFDDPDA